MDLLIKDMDMPCMCCLCPCHDWDMETNRYYCQALKDEPRIIDENTRRDDCPLVEIPTPHGDLIDKQKLLEQVGYGSYSEMKVPLSMLMSAPVVIGAEGSHITNVSKETLVISYQDGCDGYYGEDY